MAMTLYSVKDWNDHYESNQTRLLKNMRYVLIPNKQDGDGYTELVSMQDGAALYGSWIGIVLVASKCSPRGQLIRENREPHTAQSIARVTKLPAHMIARALLAGVAIRWLDSVPYEIPHLTAGFPQETAVPIIVPSHSSTVLIQGGGEGDGKRSQKRALTDLWCAEYQRFHGQKYLFQGAKDGKAADALLKLDMTVEQLISIAKEAWKRPERFNCKLAVSLSGFASRFNEICGEVKKPGVPAPDATF